MSLSLRDLRAGFGKTPVLDRVSLDVAPGETLVLFGPSGAGKTVLLRAVAGLMPGATGSVVIAGQDAAGLPAGAARPRHGVPELRALPAHVRAREHRQPVAGAWTGTRRDQREGGARRRPPAYRPRAGPCAAGALQRAEAAHSTRTRPRG